jgi:hypothetical protein
MAEWKWTSKKNQACAALASGATIKEAALIAGVKERTIYNWKNVPEFYEELNRLTLTTGIATRAERLRIAKRMIGKFEKLQGENESIPLTKKDLLDWLKYVAEETDGLKLGVADLLTELLAGLTEESE